MFHRAGWCTGWSRRIRGLWVSGARRCATASISARRSTTTTDDRIRAGSITLPGFSTLNEWGRFSLYLRGEYQHAPEGAGYSQALASQLSTIDGITFAPPNDPQETIPSGPIPAQNPFRLVEADLSFMVLGHEISGGKTDAWLGPAAGQLDGLVE